MATRSTASAMAGVTVGALTFGGLQAFVVPGAPSSSPSLRATSVASAAPSGQGQATIAALSTAAVAVAAVAGARRGGARKSVVCCATQSGKPFAGGLIGNESAFDKEWNFDPLGISVKAVQYLPWYREAELKHGRIAMLAWVGLVVPEFVRIPGNAACYGAANVVEAHNLCVGNPDVPFTFAPKIIGTVGDLSDYGQIGPLFQIYLFCGLIEFTTAIPRMLNVSQRPGLTLESAGDYRLGANFLPNDPEKVKELKLKELKNGRLAMLAFGGAITQATLSGNGFPWLYASKDSQASNVSSSLSPAGGAFAAGQTSGARSRVARQAQESRGYKMSAAVPFLPMSPALEGYAGEEEGFDPLGFTLALDIRWLREAELKHARVCMLATAGWIATDLGMRVPGEPFQAVSSLQAHDAMVKFGNMPQMLVWIGLMETFGFIGITTMLEKKTDRKPGDYGLRTFYPTDEKGQYDMQVRELRNGRLAMLAFSGIVTSAVLTGDKWPFFATAEHRQASTASAFCGASRTLTRTSLACQAMPTSKSMPFLPQPKNLAGLVGGEAEFDPLGFSDTFDVRWMREAEIKHGRVCMLASLGFLAQQFVTLPGMPETPDALRAVYTAPAGLVAVVAAAGFIESSSYRGKITMLDMFEGSDRQAGDLNFGKNFLPKDKAAAEDLATKELSNGRLAMLAFSGMVHHNLVVKGPLFPLFPEGWVGPQGSWELGSVAGPLNTGTVGAY